MTIRKDSLEELLARGEVEAALLFSPSLGPLSDRELLLVRQAWTKGLEQGKRLVGGSPDIDVLDRGAS